MSWKRSLMERFVWCAARAGKTSGACPRNPESIFVLRNNDIGDLLVMTPLFEGLRKRFPSAQIVAGVGAWNRSVLEHNPHLSEVMPVNAPWHNKFVNPQGLFVALKYIYKSEEVKDLARRRFEVGIDVLGSPFGSLLMLHAGIPCRLGVKGYAGGHSGAQQCVAFDPQKHVGRSALRFAELLGADELPRNRPQIFLSPAEEDKAEQLWHSLTRHAPRLRIVLGPGGGFKEKCWPEEHWLALARLMIHQDDGSVAVVGNECDGNLGERLAAQNPSFTNLAGRFSLRETFAVVSKADLVLCNSSMLMHAAAAFAKPAVVLLGDHFPSARAHSAQWGHPGSSMVLGKDADRRTIYSPAEAFDTIQQTLPPRGASGPCPRSADFRPLKRASAEDEVSVCVLKKVEAA